MVWVRVESSLFDVESVSELWMGDRGQGEVRALIPGECIAASVLSCRHSP